MALVDRPPTMIEGDELYDIGGGQCVLGYHIKERLSYTNADDSTFDDPDDDGPSDDENLRELLAYKLLEQSSDIAWVIDSAQRLFDFIVGNDKQPAAGGCNCAE